MLDNRLKMCAEMVSGKGIVCDVGTDHAYLAAELIKSGKCSFVIASDINEGPLESARKTVEKYGISDKVELVLSAGLENVRLDGVTDVVIAGMGGETIVEILDNFRNADIEIIRNIRLILQPMTKPEILRKWLAKNGYNFYEKAVMVSEKIYTVICCEYADEYGDLTEFDSIAGFFDSDDELVKKYRQKESERFEKVSVSLEKAGKIKESVHYSALSRRIVEGVKSEDIGEIYKFLDKKYPFDLQEKWDNSGLLIESPDMKCDKILLTLDITRQAVSEARQKGVQLIISHHPLIFEPLKKIVVKSPVYTMIENNISAICMHTNLDIANGGTNCVIVESLSERFKLSGEPQPFEELGSEQSLGWIITLDKSVSKEKLAEELKKIFGCEYIRVTKFGKNLLSKIAICSGSGGSMMQLAKEKGCDALITGDVKHDVWVDSNNNFFAIFDCGHFHTENLVLWELRKILERQFPLLDIEIAEYSVDPCIYF